MKKAQYFLMVLCSFAGALYANVNAKMANFYYVKTAPGFYERITEVQFFNGSCEEQIGTYCGYEVAPADATEAQITSTTLAELINDNKATPGRENTTWVPD